MQICWKHLIFLLSGFQRICLTSPTLLCAPLPHRAWRCNLTKNGRTGFRFDPTMVVSMLSQQLLPCSLKSARYTPLMLKNTGKVQYGKKWLLKQLVMMVLKLRWPLGGSKVQRLSFEDCCCAHYCRDDTVTKWWLFDPVLLFILRWSCFFLFLFDSDVWLFMKGLSLEARERSLFGFFLWEVCAKVTWFMLKVGTPENMLSLNSPDFLHHKFNSSTTNQET